MNKKLLTAVAAISMAASAQAAVVTYTLMLNEGPFGGFVANRYTVWVTVSPSDNSGLFAFGVDMRGQGEPGGPTTFTIVNRSPAGTWDVDDLHPNYDGGVYPTKTGGFSTGRGASNTTGIVSGVQDLAAGADLVRLYGFGQPPGHRMNDFKPAPVPNQADGSLIPYKNYAGASQTDGGGSGGAVQYGVPFNNACPTLPAGSARLATGAWTGSTAPSIDTASVNSKASVWKLNTTTDQNEIATLNFALGVCGDLPVPIFVSGTMQNANQAAGGAITVTGGNGLYSSEVDQLLDPPVNKGSAPIQTIGDEAGNLYVMMKLLGSASDLSAVAAFGDDSSDPQYTRLHQLYDSQFGPGGFNFLSRSPNFAGAKIINWDFSASFPGITVDQIAAVPEPAIALMALTAIGLLTRRRRRSQAD
jgi:hypothetical protein